jgi:hypothetical protein
MVYRWLVDTQEYDFKLEDILGVNNPVADGFSRLVEQHDTMMIVKFTAGTDVCCLRSFHYNRRSVGISFEAIVDERNV